jgi:succinyl-diaminopimelate desuccinylase
MGGMRISEDDARRVTQELIRIASMNPPGEMNECAEYVRKWLAMCDIASEIVESNGVANVVARMGSERGKKLLWDGHFDVVPPGSGWNMDPFQGVFEGGFVYGRGAADMKGGIASMMLALKELKTSGIGLNGEITFWAVGDEETGSNHGTRMLLEKMGKDYDGAVVSEPTDFFVEYAQRGLRWIEIRISGKACHAGRPHVGRNAVEYSARVMDALKRIRFDVYNEVFEEQLRRPSLSITMISGGRQANVIPEDCTLTIDRRLLPGETGEKVVSEIESALGSVRDEGFSSRVEVVNKGWDPFVTDPEDAIVKSLSSSYQEVMGGRPGMRGKGGCTDASHLYHAGIPSVIFGPGAANESHTANEKVSVVRVARAAEIFALSAIRFFG